MNNVLWTGILLLIAGIILLSCGIQRIIKQKTRKNTSSVLLFQYQSNSGMLNESYRIKLSDFMLTIESRPATQKKPKIRSKETDIDLYLAIEEIIQKAGMKTWTELKKSDLVAYDEPATEVLILFTDGKEIRFNSHHQLPKDGWLYVQEIIQLFESY